jgi:hypothetical protein
VLKSKAKGAAAERMRRKFDTPTGRAIYSRRMATVEPVFANLQNKGMRRFTLRGHVGKIHCGFFGLSEHGHNAFLPDFCY